MKSIKCKMQNDVLSQRCRAQQRSFPVLHFLFCILHFAFSSCGVPTPDGPDVEETVVATPAGTTHTMVLVPAGAFTMGSNDGVGSNEAPEHEVYVDAFHIDKYEVTNTLYTAFVEATGREPTIYCDDSLCNRPEQPVVGVSWQDAYAYCKWAGMRLPTEAEWEKAARGTDGRMYPWGDAAPDVTRLCFDGHIPKAADVGVFPEGVSPYGVHDMAGNVWEWMLDFYDPDFYVYSPNRNPVNLMGGVDLETEGSDHTVRGGSWASPAERVRTTTRDVLYMLEVDQPDRQGGFRCVREVE